MEKWNHAYICSDIEREIEINSTISIEFRNVETYKADNLVGVWLVAFSIVFDIHSSMVSMENNKQRVYNTH